MAQKKKNKLYSLFENDFKVGMFYKPTMQENDIFYHVILDNTVRLSIRVFDDKVMSIHEIIPLTDAYISKYYESLIGFLQNQTVFTVLISKIGYIPNGVAEACMKSGIPVVDDTRFLTVPERVYERLKQTYRNDSNKYGFYLLAVSDDLNIETPVQNEEEAKPETVEIVEEPKPVKPEKSIDIEIEATTLKGKFLYFLMKNNKFEGCKTDSMSNHLTVVIDLLKIIYTEYEGNIHIQSVTSVSGESVSMIFYMSFFEYVEKFLPECDIYVDEVTDNQVYNICKARGYDRVRVYQPRKNSFGTYKIKKPIISERDKK